MSLSQCTGHAGCVFPAAYRATTRFLLHTTTCTSATLPTKSSSTCEAVVRYGVEASLGRVSGTRQERGVSVRICSCLLVLLGFGDGFFFGTCLFSKFTRGSIKIRRDSPDVCLTADPEFSLGHQEDDTLLSAQEGYKGR